MAAICAAAREQASSGRRASRSFSSVFQFMLSAHSGARKPGGFTELRSGVRQDEALGRVSKRLGEKEAVASVGCLPAHSIALANLGKILLDLSVLCGRSGRSTPIAAMSSRYCAQRR